jgi:hypothetical protein
MKNKQFAQNLRLTQPAHLRSNPLSRYQVRQSNLDRYAEWFTLAVMVVLAFSPIVMLWMGK